MFWLLEKLPWSLSALIMVTAFVLLTVAAILFVRKTVNLKQLKAHHDVAGFVFTNIGVLYSVLIGFTVVNVQQRFENVKQIATKEAGYIAELYQDAEVFGKETSNHIRSVLKTYGESIINEEWAALDNGIESTKTSAAMKKIWQAYYDIKPQDNNEMAWFNESLRKLNLLMDARLSRLLGGEESLGPELWTFLIIGGLILSTFICFFGLESLTSHLLMASILAGSIAFLLFLIYSLDTAFSGSVSIPPDALIHVIESFEEF